MRFRPVMNAQDTADHILIDLGPESQADLLYNSVLLMTQRDALSLDDMLVSPWAG
jgi:hypothetical protein